VADVACAAAGGIACSQGAVRASTRILSMPYKTFFMVCLLEIS
jgi:hypothetical protein